MLACSSIASAFPKVLTIFLFCYTGFTTLVYVDAIPRGLTLTLLGPIFVLSIYTYFTVIKVGAGSPLEFSELRITDVSAADQGLEFPPEFLTKRSVTLKRNGRFRFCRICNVWKPDRCHHCSSCNVCYLKLDHHCPWFASCVGFRNQKYFVQFLIQATTYSLVVFFIAGTHFLLWFRNERYKDEVINLQLLIVWILSVIITISMAAFTGYTVYLVTQNRTTIETYEWSEHNLQSNLLDEVRGTQTRESTNLFDLGSASRNWQCVMGQSCFEWVFPIPTQSQLRSRHTLDESGLYFEVNRDWRNEVSESMTLQEQLMRRLTPRSSYDHNNSRPFALGD
ncbi:LADA_0D00408g1_1 [Lachancea dasiensis]|uniref:Palmitoyltransferase n=1 Tax=Lachancea dasiensis TaxID=1072105 RepID=A0A1G4J3M7_9SACH|nr:LADA_0D00408g1_1 [Lachancea dasiensis]